MSYLQNTSVKYLFMNGDGTATVVYENDAEQVIPRSEALNLLKAIKEFQRPSPKSITDANGNIVNIPIN